MKDLEMPDVPDVYTVLRSSDEEEKEKSRFHRIYSKFCSNAINLVFHVLMFAIFEPIFFFAYATGFETDAYVGSIDGYTGDIINRINGMDPEYIKNIRDLFFGTDAIDKIKEKVQELHVAAIEAADDRNAYNTDLMNNSVIIGCSILFIGIVLIVMAKMKNIKIGWSKIFMDNFTLLFMIGIYEYVFFETVVSKYKIMSSDELNYHVLERIITESDILTS
jgi:hypothetical protein